MVICEDGKMGLPFSRYRLHFLLFACLSALSFAVPAFGQESTAEPAFANVDLLVDTEWLADHLADSTLRIIDMRAPRDYAEGHVPGAVNVPVDAISSTIDNISLEFDEAEVQAALNSIGLTPDMTAVIYDDLGMLNSARLFWTLEYVGHHDARVLNGGWNAWAAGGLETTTDTSEIQPTEYPLDLQPDRLITREEVLAILDDPAYVIVDARSPEEYSGEATFSDRAGHIPGAVLLNWRDALTGGDVVSVTEPNWQVELQDEDVEVFKSPAEIQALLDARGISPDTTTITYCQTFWRGAHLYFLLRLMGYDNVRGYDGSWSEWGNLPDTPIVVGDQAGTLADAQTE
jgi:thiosulfate/3-mercaptopyruvate sulfurtransferase